MRFVNFAMAFALSISIAYAEKSFYITAFAPDDTRQASVVVKRLDDPNNPYKAQYSAYDLWCVEHYNYYMVPEDEMAWQLGLSLAQGFHPSPAGNEKLGVDRSKGLTMVRSRVDENGFMLPHFRKPEINSGKSHVPTLADFADSSQGPQKRRDTVFYSLGFMPNELVEEMRKQWHSPEWSSFYPKIQQWMVAQNKKTVLLPDGGAVFINEVLANPNGKPGNWLVERYAADATPVKSITTTSDKLWQRILSDIPDFSKSPYFRKIPHVRATGETNYSTNARGINGRYQVFEGENGTTLAVIDYWQNKVFTPETDGPDFMHKLPVQMNYFIAFDAQLIAQVYLAQQELATQ